MPILTSCLAHEQTKNLGVFQVQSDKVIWGALSLSLINFFLCVLLEVPCTYRFLWLHAFYNVLTSRQSFSHNMDGEPPLRSRQSSYMPRVSLLLVFSAKPEMRHPCSHEIFLSLVVALI